MSMPLPPLRRRRRIRAVPERRDVPNPSPAVSSIGALPVDAVYEILLRLPAKLLCRLRAVCRPWRALLSDPQFAAAHSARHPGPLIVAGYAENEGDGMIVDIMDLSGQIVKRVRRVEGRDRVMSIELDLAFVKNVDSGSYQFLFAPTGDMYRLCHYRFLNPATGAVYHLPDGFAEENVAFGVNLITEPKFILGQGSTRCLN
nr:unnamed protein product [Digitaria exilis]